MTSKTITNKIKHVILILSCVCLIYALFLLFVKFLETKSDYLSPMGGHPPFGFYGIAIGTVLELCTSPFFYLLIILLSANIIIMHLKKWSIELEYLFSTLILLATMVIVCVLTTFYC